MTEHERRGKRDGKGLMSNTKQHGNWFTGTDSRRVSFTSLATIGMNFIARTRQRARLLGMGCVLAAVGIPPVWAQAPQSETVLHKETSPGTTHLKTIWRFTEAGFDNGNGLSPNNGLVFDSQGKLYGTTSAGGISACSGGCGTVFQLKPPAAAGDSWTETVLYSFAGGPDGESPVAGLVFGPNGGLYGL